MAIGYSPSFDVSLSHNRDRCRPALVVDAVYIDTECIFFNYLLFSNILTIGFKLIISLH
jgi:hypothetical protein